MFLWFVVRLVGRSPCLFAVAVSAVALFGVEDLFCTLHSGCCFVPIVNTIEYEILNIYSLTQYII